MKKIVVMLLAIPILSFAQDKEIALSSIKDKKMVKCLSDYVKNHKTHITMIIKNGKPEIYIPEEYVKKCKKSLNK